MRKIKIIIQSIVKSQLHNNRKKEIIMPWPTKEDTDKGFGRIGYQSLY